MVRLRGSKKARPPAEKKPDSAKASTDKNPAAKHPGYTPDGPKRGLTERQWWLGLLVLAGLLLLFTFRGCILPSGVGPEGPSGGAATATPQATVTPAAGEYTVEAGDTLSEIATKTGTTVEALAEANGINLNQRIILQVGQTLQIPGQ